MNERCPLLNIEWDGEIPNVCRETCEDIWNTAIQTQESDVDLLNRDCEDSVPCSHTSEHGGTVIQRSDGAVRYVGILNICSSNGAELFTDNFRFDCPNNE